jgi:hypothetical protein
VVKNNTRDIKKGEEVLVAEVDAIVDIEVLENDGEALKELD